MRHESKNPLNLPSRKTNRKGHCKLMVGRWISFWDGLLPGDMLVSWRVILTLSKLTQDNWLQTPRLSQKSAKLVFFSGEDVYNPFLPSFPSDKKSKLAILPTQPLESAKTPHRATLCDVSSGMPGSLSAGNFREKLVLAYFSPGSSPTLKLFIWKLLIYTCSLSCFVGFEGIPFSKLQHVGEQWVAFDSNRGHCNSGFSLSVGHDPRQTWYDPPTNPKSMWAGTRSN